MYCYLIVIYILFRQMRLKNMFCRTLAPGKTFFQTSSQQQILEFRGSGELIGSHAIYILTHGIIPRLNHLATTICKVLQIQHFPTSALILHSTTSNYICHHLQSFKDTKLPYLHIDITFNHLPTASFRSSLKSLVRNRNTVKQSTGYILVVLEKLLNR